MSTAQYERLTGEPVGRLTLSLAVPAVIGMMITTIYNMVDTWFVAKLGTQAVAACGITLSIQELTMSVGYWFGMGGGTAIGLLLGARKTAMPRLKQASLPVSTSLSDLMRTGPEAELVGRLHSRVVDFSSLCRAQTGPMGLAFTTKPVVL